MPMEFAEVQAAYTYGMLPLRNPELAGFVPSALMELRGIPMISFARFKGPTRLGLSNLFGLIRTPCEPSGTGRTSPTSHRSAAT